MSDRKALTARNFTGCEYKQIAARDQTGSLWVDSMAYFGWKVEKSRPKTVERLPFALWIMAVPLSLLPGRPFQCAA